MRYADVLVVSSACAATEQTRADRIGRGGEPLTDLAALFEAAAHRAGHWTAAGSNAYVCGRLGVDRLPPGLAGEPVPESEAQARELGARYGIPGWLLWLFVSDEAEDELLREAAVPDGFAERVISLASDQRQILELLAKGLDDAEIAARLGQSRDTIAARVGGLYLWFSAPAAHHPRVWLVIQYRRLTRRGWT
jgi:hypothetical protein